MNRNAQAEKPLVNADGALMKDISLNRCGGPALVCAFQRREQVTTWISRAGKRVPLWERFLG